MVLDSPLHMAAYVLNSYFSYVDRSIFTTANKGFQESAEQYFANDHYTCMLVVNDEFPKYENKEGPFGKRLAKACENKSYSPGILACSCPLVATLFLLLPCYCCSYLDAAATMLLLFFAAATLLLLLLLTCYCYMFSDF